jgi:dienelactone hydrolase
LFALFLTWVNLPDLAALFSGLQSDSYRDRRLLFILITGGVFAAVLWVSLYFAPPLDMELLSERVETIQLRDPDRTAEFTVRIYGPEESAVSADRPLLILLPPVAGSLPVIDAVCGALRERGFTVISYSRAGFDSPAFDGTGMPVRLSLPGLYRLTNALGRGLSDEGANAGGRELEEGRRFDVEFLLQELSVNKTLRDKLSGADRNRIFLAGYGAGGAALTVLAGMDDFISAHPQVRGVIAVEGPLLSSLEGDVPPPSPPVSDNPADAFIRRAADFAEGFIPKKITHIGTIPRPALPILFILSDRVIQNRSGRYETILRTLGAARNMALLAAVPGAGPFDYSDSPRYYPIYSALFRGAVHREGQAAGPLLTASLAANFAALILETPQNGEMPAGNTLTTTVLDSGIHLETGGVWQIPQGRTILQP